MVQIRLRSTDSSLPMFDHKGKEIKCNRDCWNSGFFAGDKPSKAIWVGRLQQCAFVQLVQLEERRHGRRVVERQLDTRLRARAVQLDSFVPYHLLLHFPPSTTWIYFECPFEHLWARDSLPLRGFAAYLLLPPDLNLSVLLERR